MEWKLNFRDDGIMEIIARGDFSVDDFKKMTEQIIADPRWKPGINTISDFRDLNINNIDFKDIYKIEKIHLKFDDEIGSGKIALIFEKDLGFGMGRSYEAISNRVIKSKIRTFRNYEDGINWIREN